LLATAGTTTTLLLCGTYAILLLLRYSSRSSLFEANFVKHAISDFEDVCMSIGDRVSTGLGFGKQLEMQVINH
jgi:hypothetical protein